MGWRNTLHRAHLSFLTEEDAARTGRPIPERPQIGDATSVRPVAWSKPVSRDIGGGACESLRRTGEIVIMRDIEYAVKGRRPGLGDLGVRFGALLPPDRSVWVISFPFLPAIYE